MTTFFERPEDYLGETVTAEPAWFFQEFKQDPPRPRGYKGGHRWHVQRRSPRGGAR